MNKSVEKLLSDLYLNFQNLADISKIEKDVKKLKDIESEMNKINNLSRSLTSYINFYKLKDNKKSN